MYEVEVEVVKSQVGQRLPAGRLHVVRVVFGVPELAGDEDLPARDPAGPDARPHLLLVPVPTSAVYEISISHWRFFPQATNYGQW